MCLECLYDNVSFNFHEALFSSDAATTLQISVYYLFIYFIISLYLFMQAVYLLAKMLYLKNVPCYTFNNINKVLQL